MIKKIFKIGLALVLFSLPALALAEYGGGGVQGGLDTIGGLFPGSGPAASRSLLGPYGLIYQVINILLLLAGAIAVLFVIIGGFWYVTSAGNAEQAEKGQQTLINAIIGIVVVVLAYVIINVIVNLVTYGF